MLIIDETSQQHIRPSMMLHGVTGAGKSTWAVTGGRPLVILTEPKAASVLRQINPLAVGLAPESLGDLLKIFEILGQADRLAARGIDRIVLDSFTELTYTLPRWIKESAGQVQILTKMQKQEYGDLREYALALVKAVQLTGYPSIIIARSTAKEFGSVRKIVPDGLGKSVEELPGKLLPTVEARFDPDLGYVVDSTPVEYSQRCGLPWVPSVWSGTALDFLATVERTHTTTPTPAPAPATAPEASASPVAPAGEGATTPEAQDAVQLVAQGAPAPEPTTAAEVFQQAQAEVLASKKAPTPEADAFVEDLARGCWLSPEDCVEITDAAYKGKVDLKQLASYLNKKGWMPNVQDWTRIHEDALAPMRQHLKDPKLTAFKAHLKSHFPGGVAA